MVANRATLTRHERAADVFGVILATAVARMTCFTQRSDIITGGWEVGVGLIAPEGDKEFGWY